MPPLPPVLQRLDNAWGRVRGWSNMAFECRGRRQTAAKQPGELRSPESLLELHAGCDATHINACSLRAVLRQLAGRPADIVETGSSAWGTDSTCLWDSYVQHFGGRVWSVDIRHTASRQLRGRVSSATTLITDDSVRFLTRFCRHHPHAQIGLVYLDSWDLDPRSPLPAAVHCVREYEAIQPLLRDGALLLVDDTPASEAWLTSTLRDEALQYRDRHGIFPGKGMLLDPLLERNPRVEKLHHRYQALYRFA